MSDQIKRLADQIRMLEEEMEAEFARRRDALDYTIESGRARFDAKVAARHKQLQTALVTYVTGARPLIVLTAPVIYAVIIPFVLLDVFVTVYQAVCFPVYGLEKVRRRDHIVFDRHRLHYLNGIEKLNCVYCSYGNGLISFTREIAARTESYWCPIKHARRMDHAHGAYRDFAEYGDAGGYRARVEAWRERVGGAPRDR